MGFFKKIGTAIKKGVKQISLKNIVKVGTPLLSMIPVVGGLASTVVGGISDAAAAKKQAKEAEKAQADYDASVLAQQAQQLADAGQIAQSQALAQKSAALNAKSQVLAQEAGALVGQQTGSLFNAFTKGATNEMLAQQSEGFQQSTGMVGSAIMTNTLSEWFKAHWLIVVGIVGGVVGLVLVLRSPNHKR